MCTPARSSLFEQIIAVMYISIVQRASAQEFLTADLLTLPHVKGYSDTLSAIPLCRFAYL